MNKVATTRYRNIKKYLHLDQRTKMRHWRYVVHTIIFWCLITVVYITSIQSDFIAIILGIITISYIPFMVIETYHRTDHLAGYLYGGYAIIGIWTMLGMINSQYLINTLWSIGFLSIGRWVHDYCRIAQQRKMRSLYNQVSTIGVFLISIVFAIITMQRFQSINFSCTNINFLSTQFAGQFTKSDPSKVDTVTQAVASGGRTSYLELVDQWLKTDNSDSLSNTIKTQVRNGVIVVMDQKQLYDKSICDYVTTALNDNYQKPSFFYSGLLLLTFVGLPAARIALIIVASVFSLILLILRRLGVYRSHTTLVEHHVLE